jgi:hypothetical protein
MEFGGIFDDIFKGMGSGPKPTPRMIIASQLHKLGDGLLAYGKAYVAHAEAQEKAKARQQ